MYVFPYLSMWLGCVCLNHVIVWRCFLVPAVTDLHFQAIFENSRDAVIERERVIYINQKNMCKNSTTHYLEDSLYLYFK